MKVDDVKIIKIDNLERLCIYPEKERFPLIWRSATEVHWDNSKSFLYSPKPREWSYLDWYKHITNLVSTEYHCELNITGHTEWINIPDDLKKQIIKG